MTEGRCTPTGGAVKRIISATDWHGYARMKGEWQALGQGARGIAANEWFLAPQRDSSNVAWGKRSAAPGHGG